MANTERCICCGKEIPEGSQVCIICGYKSNKKQRRIDRIRNMSVEELAIWLTNLTKPVERDANGRYTTNATVEYYKQYLESEEIE